MESKQQDNQSERRYPVGAEIDGAQIDFRIWAPEKKTAQLVLNSPAPQTIPMLKENGGYFSVRIADPGGRVLYRFRLDGDDRLLTDPASRYQPEGPLGPSEVVRSNFEWTDGNWQGVTVNSPLIYEMHAGTFTREGTWQAAGRQLTRLAEDGIDIIELMPIGDFVGTFGWGYDGVNLFAPCRVYGPPDDLRRFIDEAHRNALAVILDIVYNHIGPEGNDLASFSQHYFTDRYTCEWGQAMNFDGPMSGPVREFFLTNVRYWIEEFHFDGFRIDATQQIFDSTHPHIIAQIAQTARRAAGKKDIYITGENEPQQRILVDPVSEGGYGFDAIWNDDFHHTMRTILTGRNDAYLSDYSGSPQEIVSAAKYGCLYQGQFSRWQQNFRGTIFRGIEHRKFICYLQNHDQTANSAWGYRLSELTSAARGRAAMALLLLGPWTPMIFQGQEFNASTPFLYFADHERPLSEHVGKGRKEFLSQFPGIATAAMQEALHDPADKETFLKSKLDHRQRQADGRFVAMFRRLSDLHHRDPTLSACDLCIDGAVLGPQALVIRYWSQSGDRLLVCNFGPNLFFSPAPEPLLARPRGFCWEMIFSTEDPGWGGSGTPDVENKDGWRLPAECTLLFSMTCDKQRHGAMSPRIPIPGASDMMRLAQPLQ